MELHGETANKMDFYDKLIKAIIIVLIWLLLVIVMVTGTVLIMTGTTQYGQPTNARQGGNNERHKQVSPVHDSVFGLQLWLRRSHRDPIVDLW